MPARARRRRAADYADGGLAAGLAASLEALGRAWLTAAATTAVRPSPRNVHRLRVATRRLRGALDLCAGSVDPAPLRRLRRALRRPFRRAGRLRDLHVAGELLAVWADRDPGARALRPQVAAAAAEPRRKLGRALRASRRARVARRLAGVATALATRTAQPNGPDDVAAGIHFRLAGLALDCRQAAATGTADGLHRARLRVKRLRYATEVTVALGVSDAGLPEVRTLRALQRELGACADLALLVRLIDGAREPGEAPPALGRLRARAARAEAAAARRARAALATFAAAAPDERAPRLDTPGRPR